MLFRPNVETPAQLGALVTDLRRAAPAQAPLAVAADQEGGLVQRVRAPATVTLEYKDARDLTVREFELLALD